MSKKTFTTGIDSVLGSPAETPTPDKPTKPQSHRATFIMDEADVEKIRAIAYWERRKVTAVANDMIKSYLKSYEKKNGEIQPIPKEANK